MKVSEWLIRLDNEMLNSDINMEDIHGQMFFSFLVFELTKSF